MREAAQLLHSEKWRRAPSELPKGFESFPKSIITQNRADKGDAKNPQATLLKRQYEQSLLGTIPVPKAGEAACINAGLLDMLVMCNVTFNVVQSAWFKRFCAVLRPGFEPQCKPC